MDLPDIDTGSTSWMLASTALVLLMTPGLAFFYGGLNRSKSVLNMMMMSFSSIGLISILWLFYGYSVAFGDDVAQGSHPGFWGDLNQYLGTDNSLFSSTFIGLPSYVFMAFQMMFAIITVALISGSLSDRTKFVGWLIFAAVWFTVVYGPVAHMVWGGGFIGSSVENGGLGVKDFAGGTAVHINAGAAALALAIVLGKRVGWPKAAFKPHNVPFVALGAGLLWFGWFGFNAGSEGGVDFTTALAFLNTQVATAAALLGWIIAEWIKGGRPSLVGASSGAVAGLVAITPACAFITPLWSVVLGLVAGFVCAFAVGLKYLLKFDDSLDVFGVHFVGGWIGTLWIGIFGSEGVSDAGESLLHGGNGTFLLHQFFGAGIVSVWSFVVALVVGYILKAVKLLKVKPDVEVEGIDATEHKETAYSDDSAAVPAGEVLGAHAGA